MHIHVINLVEANTSEAPVCEWPVRTRPDGESLLENVFVVGQDDDVADLHGRQMVAVTGEA